LESIKPIGPFLMGQVFQHFGRVTPSPSAKLPT
jgi:hypothetical protein